MNLFRRFAAIAALVVMTLSWLALPAGAHTGFESSDPADGSTVTGELDSIVLSFSGQAEPAGEGFVILDSTGVTRVPDTVTAGTEQKVWTLGFEPPLAAGPSVCAGPCRPLTPIPSKGASASPSTPRHWLHNPEMMPPRQPPALPLDRYGQTGSERYCRLTPSPNPPPKRPDR